MALTREQQALLRRLQQVLSQRQLEQYEPYPKQVEFHNAGGVAGVRERLLMAGNQLGKTLCASFEVAMHATGRYPEWWQGARFAQPTSGWCASNTSQGTRDGVQRLLLGKPGAWGTGAIPKADILEIKRSVHGVPDAVESIVVRHHPTGGVSHITLKTYDQGRERWQSETLQYVWFDEEPGLDIYTEGLTRTNATRGIVFMTFTPLKGVSDVVKRFLIEKLPGTHVTHMQIEDAKHIPPDERQRIIMSYPEWERDARTRGIPTMGSGRVFPFEDSLISEPQIMIPDHWPRIVGVDFGYDHPAAGVWIAWDRDTDTAHIYHAYRSRLMTPVVHAATIRAQGVWIPVAWPHDGEQRDKGSGAALATQYRTAGANMLPFHATHAPDPRQGQREGDGGISFEAGITMMYDRMQTGKLKIAKHLNDLWEEFHLYHRQDGQVVKVGDDIMSAARVGLMMLRHAKIKQQPKQQRAVKVWTSQDPGMGYLG